MVKIRDSREDITSQLYKLNKSYKHLITSQGPRRLEYKSSIIDESAEATISEYRYKLNKFADRKSVV